MAHMSVCGRRRERKRRVARRCAHGIGAGILGEKVDGVLTRAGESDVEEQQHTPPASLKCPPASRHTKVPCVM